jgi:hypothetical protein
MRIKKNEPSRVLAVPQVKWYLLRASLSTGAQYVTLDNKIKCLSLVVVFFFFGQPHQLELYIQGNTNSKPLGPIIMIN